MERETEKQMKGKNRKDIMNRTTKRKQINKQQKDKKIIKTTQVTRGNRQTTLFKMWSCTCSYFTETGLKL